MRQVPHYLLIGNGRVSQHFQHYLSLLSLSFSCWHRAIAEDQLAPALSKATHVLLLISDSAIDTFSAQHLAHSNATLIHFSGSLVSKRAIGAHPLMTFHSALYDLATYQTVPFVIDQEAPCFAELFPGLINPHVRLDPSMKAKYHALCVLSGNFSCLLWQKLFTSLENEFHIPASFAQPYLQRQTQNLLSDYKNALTGPLMRGEAATLEKNMAALAGDPFLAIYKSFVSCFEAIKKSGNGE